MEFGARGQAGQQCRFTVEVDGRQSLFAFHCGDARDETPTRTQQGQQFPVQRIDFLAQGAKLGGRVGQSLLTGIKVVAIGRL